MLHPTVIFGTVMNFARLNQSFLIIFLSIVTMGCLWEFIIEPLFSKGAEPLSTRVEYIITIIVFVVLSLIYPYLKLKQWHISEHYRQQELLQAKQKAEQASRAKTEFVAQLSHELKNPIGSIKGYTELLASTPPETTTYLQIIERIKHACDFSYSILSDTLDIAAVESGYVHTNVEKFDLKQLVEECIEMLTPQASEKSVTMSADSEIPNTVLESDRRLVKQILLNLMSNAIKYNKYGGQIRLYTSRDEQGSIRLGVSDTGPGIADHEQQKIFDPFVRLNSKEEGSGIGLNLTQKLAHHMGVTLGVVSAPGLGSTFWLEFCNNQKV